jgi:autotransporter-associated beta strand protein
MTAAYNGTATIDSPIILGSSLLISNNGTSAGPQLALADSVDLAGNAVTFSGTSNTSVSGSIMDSIGTGNLTLSSGVLILSGSNTYTGLTTVSAGTLLLSGAGTLGAATAALTVSGGTLNLGGTTPNNIGTVTISGGNIQNGTLTSTADYAGQSGTVSAILGGTVGLNKTTGGILTLSGVNTYTGATSVSVGTLELNNPNGTPSISNTNTLTINTGGTLLTDTSGQLNVGVKMVLNGGTWATNALNSTNASPQASFTESLNTLTLTATSNITLGNGSGSATNTINFAASESANWTPDQILYINNWTGNASSNMIDGGGGQDEIFFGTSAAGLNGTPSTGQLGEIIFVNPQDAANGLIGASGDFQSVILSSGEVVPFLAAPEPGTEAAGAALGSLALLREWRRRKNRVTVNNFK